MIELLKLCGFEGHEIELELPRINKAFNKLGITSEDVERGKKRLIKYYDMELQGVRKIFSIFMRELVNLMLSRDEGKKKIIYPAVFQGCPEIPAAAVYASEDVHATIPDALIQLVFGSIFGKLDPILEAAEKQWLRAGRFVTHCGMVKTKVGLFGLNLIPKPDLFVTMDILCDTGSKSGDLAHELLGVPTYSIGVVQDRGFDEFPDVKRDGDFLEKGLRRYAKKVEKVVGFEITDEMLWEVLRDKASYGRIAYQIQDLVEKSDPLPISATHEIIWALLGSFPLDRKSMRAAIDALGTLYEELQERVNRGVGVIEKGAPRILATVPSAWTYPDLEHLIGEVGIAVAATEGGSYQPDGRHGSGMREEKDPFKIIAHSNFMSCFHNSTRGRIAIIIAICKRTGVVGVLDRYHVGCRYTVGDALMIKDAVTKELEIPVLPLEIESFDPRFFDEDQCRRSLNVFKTMLETRQ